MTQDGMEWPASHLEPDCRRTVTRRPSTALDQRFQRCGRIGCAAVGAWRWKRRRRHPLWALLPILPACLAIGVIAIVVGLSQTTKDDDFWKEFASRGLELVAVGLIGGGLAATWKLSIKSSPIAL